MFKNCVFKPNVSTIQWLKSALVRAIKTFAQTMVSMLTIGQALMDIDWLQALSVSCVASIISILTSISGIPEVEEKNDESEDK